MLPGTGIDSASFWRGFDAIVHDLAPKNIALLVERDRLQTELDAWHQAHPGPITAGDATSPTDMNAYRAFLEKIGYLVPAPKKVHITTSKVDTELAVQAGPQLVVPLLNTRYALNAANARWGSLYDALYGTDVISEADGAEKGHRYNPLHTPILDILHHKSQSQSLAYPSCECSARFGNSPGSGDVRIATGWNRGRIQEHEQPAIKHTGHENSRNYHHPKPFDSSLNGQNSVIEFHCRLIFALHYSVMPAPLRPQIGSGFRTYADAPLHVLH